MADANANIRIDVDTSDALAQIKALQRQISVFHSSMAQSGKAAAAESAKMQANLINSINATKGFTAGMTSIRTSTESFTNSLEKNKFSMGEYFRYAGASTKTFGKLFKSEFNTINKVARERTKDLQTQYIKLGRDASGAMKAIKVRPTTLDMKNFGTQTAIAAQKQQLFNQLIKQGSTNLLNWGKNTQWAGRQLMVGFTIPLTIMGATASREFMKLEEQAIRFRRVYGDMFTTDKETRQALSNVRELAKEFTKFGVAVEDTIDLAASVAQMGAMGADLTNQVTQATRLAVLGGIEQQEALDTTISLTNAFGLATDQLAGKIAFLNAAENQTILSIEDFNEAIPKAGSVVKQLGGDVEDLAYFLTAMREGGVNASQSANALKSSLARLINPTEVAREKLAGFGIDILGIVNDNAGNLRGTIQVLAQELDKLNPLDKSRAIEQLFGKFQFARMSTLFENIVKDGSQANKVLQLTTNSAEELAIIADRELNRVSESPMYKFKKALEDFQASLAPIGQAFLELATPLIEFGNRVLDQFNSLSDGTKRFITGAIAIGGVVAPALIMVVGLIANAIANTIKFGLLIRNAFTGAAKSSDILTDQYQYMNSEQIEAAAVAASLDQVHAKLKQTFTAEAAAVDRLTQAYDRSIAKQRQMAMASAGKGGKTPKGYNDGVVSVPGPKGAGDIVPAMLAPGEAVIPAKMADKYGPLIKAMISGNIPGYMAGTTGVKKPQPYHFAHHAPGKMVGGNEALANLNLPAGLRKRIEALMDLDPKGMVDVKHAYGSRMRGSTNIALNPMGPSGKVTGRGADISTVAEEFTGKNIEQRYGEMFDLTGDSRKDPQLQQEFKNYDAAMSKKMKDLKKAGIESIVDTEEQWKKMPKDRQKVTRSLESIDKEVAKDIGKSNKKFAATRTKALGTIRDVRIGPSSLSDPRLAEKAIKNPSRFKNILRRKSSQSDELRLGTSNQSKRAGGFGQMSVFNDGLEDAAQTKSPSKRTRKIAKDTVDGYANELERGKKKIAAAAKKKNQAQLKAEEDFRRRSEASRKGWETRRLRQEQAAMRQQEQVPTRRMGLGGRMAGAGAAATSVAMMASMAPGKIGEIAGQAMMPLMGLSMILPMLTSGLGAAVVALGLLAAGGFALVSSFNKAQDEAIEMANAMGAGTEAIESLAKASGNVSAGQVLDRRRETEGELFQVAAGKSTFGETFMEGDQGAALLDNVKKSLSSGGMQQVQAQITNQMATAVASGALEPGQARSIVAELANQLGDYKFGIEVNSKLIELLGPNGENLVTDPLEVRVKLIQETRNQLEGIGGLGASAQGQASQTAAVAGSTGLLGGIAGATAGSKMLKSAGGKLAAKVSTGILARIGAGLATGAVAGPVGAAIGTIVGVGMAGIEIKNALQGLGTASGAIVASGAIALQQQQELLDSLQLDYERRIASANAAGDAAEATRLENEYLAQRQQLLAVGAETMQGLVGTYSDSNLFGKFGLDRAADKGLKELYKDNPLQQQVLDGVVDQVKKATSGEQEYQLKLSLLSKDLSPAELSRFLSTFENDKATIDRFIDINTNLGSTEGSRALQVMNLFESPERQAKFLANINTSVPAEADKYLSFFMDIAKSGNIVGLDAVLNFYQDNPAAAAQLMADIDKIEEIAAKGPQQLTAYQSVLGEEEMKALLEYNADFEKLDSTNQILYIQTFKTIYETEGSPDFMSGKLAAERETGSSMTAEQYSAYQADKAVSAGAGMSVPAAPEVTTPTGSGSGPKASVFDDLTKSLRNTRSAAIDAEKGWKAATNSLNDLFKGGKKTLDVFDGLANQMRGVGASENMIEKIVGMDPDEYEKRKDELFNFDPDGRIVGVTNKFKSLQAAMNAQALGDYVNTQQSFISNTKNQFTAMNKLTAQGMAFTDAYKMVQDQALATAIAMSASTEEVEELISVMERMQEMQEKMDKENEKSQAVDAVKRTNKEFEERYRALGKIAKEQDKLSDSQINEILSDPNLTKLYLNPSLDPATLEKRLRQAEARANLELRLKVATEEGKEEIFNQEMGEIQDQFSRKEREIEIGFKLATEADDDIVRDAQNKIAKIQFEIDDYQAELEGIADQEDKINERYDKRYEALEKVASSQEKIARAQQAQLDVADALSRGDIAAAARAQQELRDQEAQAAREEQRAQLERAQAAEIANVRSTSGKSREQLEDAIKGKRDEIFKIEEEELEPAQERIRLAEYEKNVAIDNLEIAGRTRDEWDKIANAVDLATVNADEFAKSIERALALYEYFVNGTPLDGSLFGEDELQELINSGQVKEEDVYNPPAVTETEDPAKVLGPAIVSAIEEGQDIDESKLTERQLAAKNLYEVNRLGKEGALATIQRQLSDPRSANKVATRIAKEAGIIGEDGGFAMSADAAERAMQRAIDAEATRLQRLRDQIASKAYADKVGTTNPDALDRAYQKDISSIGRSTNIGAQTPAQIAASNLRDRIIADKRNDPAPKPSYTTSYNRTTPTPAPKPKTYTTSYNRTPPKPRPKPAPPPIITPARKKAIASSASAFKSSGMSLRAYMRSAGGSIPGYSIGGGVRGYSFGGFAKSLGSDNVPAMLTPGEFVIRRPAVQSIGMDKLEKMNKTGTYNDGSVYNYNLAVNVSSMSDPDKIANTVMREIKRVESQRVRGNRF